MTGANSGEVIGKGRENPFSYVVMDTRQSVGDREASELLWGSLAETYAEGGCEIHVHFRAGLVNGGIAGDWCAVFNRECDWLDFISSGASRNPKGQMRDTSEGCDVRQPMLVLSGKLVELPEGVVGGTALPSVVRLQPLDDCFRVWVDAPKHAIEFFQVMVATGSENGERRITLDTLRQWPAFIRQCQLEGEVVECGAEIMKTVTNDKTQFGGGRWLEDFDPKELLSAINLGFGPSSARVFFKPSVHYGLKALQVIERPAEPSFVVEGHGV